MTDSYLCQTFVQFQFLLAHKIQEYPNDKLRPRELRQIIRSAADAVKEKHRATSEKAMVRRAVKSFVRDAEQSFSGSGDNKREQHFRREDALFRHFGGILEPITDGSPLLVVRTGANETSAFAFGDAFDREYLAKLSPRPNRAVMLTREGRKELDLKDRLPMLENPRSGLVELESKTVPFSSLTEESDPVTTTSIATEQNLDPSEETCSKTTGPNPAGEVEYLGWTLTTERRPFTWGSKKCQVTGYLKGELPLREDDLLAADDSRNSPTKTLILRTVAVKTYNKGATVLTKKVEETINLIEFEPIFEMTNNYQGDVRPGNIDNYQLRLPNNDELRKACSLAKTGLPLGLVETHAAPLTFFYPRQPGDLLYQSLFVTGVQGSGKTTFVRLLTRVLSGLQDVPLDERPAVVILDGEGDYLRFHNSSQLATATRCFLEEHHISDIKPHVIRVSTSDDADRTLSLEGIAASDLIYLVPELPPKSTEVAAEVIRKCCDDQLEPLTVRSLRGRVIDEVLRNQQIARTQKSAIVRAFEFSSNLHLFDVLNKPPLRGEELLVPGGVTVIDVSDLTEDQKRTVALYLLLCFDKSKVSVSSSSVGLLLVLDEAHRLFPRKAPSIHKEYVEKVAAKINNIVHRGRKRKYGLVLATQSPADVYPLISDLCNTKVVFHTEGSTTWLSSNLGPDLVKKVRKLSKGECILNLRGTGYSTATVQIQVPNVSDLAVG